MKSRFFGPGFKQKYGYTHCVKSIHIRNYSGLHFPTFGLNAERYGVSILIQSECGKMGTRITPNTDTFHAVSRLVNKERRETRASISKKIIEIFTIG